MEKVNNVKDLREVVRTLERKLGILGDLEASCCGVSFAQCHAVVEIGRAQKLSLNELADILGLEKSTMSRTINNLVETDVVMREENPDDRRFVTIRLTEKGKQIFQTIETSMNNYFETIYHAVPEHKRAQVLESLQLLIEAINSNDCCNKC